MSDFADARARMVDSQLRPNAVTSRRLLAVMGEISREIFVPASKKPLAYIDADIEVADEAGAKRYLMSPMYFAKLVQLAGVGPSDLVLDVGCASGYSTAVLARLADAVVAIDGSTALVAAAADNLARLGIDNAAVVEADMAGGYPDEGPYDVIIFNGEIGEVPAAYASQLRQHGRLVAIVRQGPVGRGMIFRKAGSGLSGVAEFDAAAKPLPGFAKTPEFVF
ncbi:MAG: protein-L-isoaspartate O-methyltransferase [Flavobacteriaceae bacterium]